MRAKAGFLILLGLIILIGTVTADMADAASTISAGKEWPVANNADASVITVVARNTSSVSIPAVHGVPVTVAFTVDDAAYGSFSAPTVTTDSSGVATSSFNTKTKSGTAVITATITSDDGGFPHTTVLTINQKIDHDKAQYAAFNNQVVLPVATVTTFNITLTDRWGNLIDNKNPAEVHTITLYMPGEQGRGLWDGSVYKNKTTLTADSSGKAPVTCRVAEIAGTNWIYVDPIGNMAIPPETWIEGIALDEPYFMNQIHPSPDDINADRIAYFELSYYLYDKYMNPVNNTPVHISATDGTSIDDITNINGAFFATFGPKDTASVYTITSTAGANASVHCLSTGTSGFCSQNLTFHNTEPVDLIVSAEPQGMPSLDSNPASRGKINAKVVDIKGNPVIGETVTFTMGTPTYPDGPYNETSPPSVSPGSALTATGGYAISTFTPGAFATAATPDSFNATATGQVTVTATWTHNGTTKSQDVVFIWKNYPYLSIMVPDNVCSNVQVGDQINISVNLFGDGAALKPKPIDVVLVTDVSGSMGSPSSKIADAKTAGKIFGSSLSDQDRIGLESYGWSSTWPYTWSAYSRDDMQLTYISAATRTAVNTTINTYSANGNTPQRPAIYNATHMIKNSPRSGTVKAIVLMTDGEWNICGDPTGARTTGCDGATRTRMAWVSPQDPVTETESVVNYAKNNGIRIYTVGLGVSSCSENDLKFYSSETGGKYYYAPTSAQLATIYAQIAGDLQEIAGGNTQVYLNYGNVTVNGLPANIHNYMDYVTDISMPAQESDSTFVRKTNLTKSGVTNLLYEYSQDDSSNWSAGSMTFNVGEIRLNESWSSKFRVNLTQAGQIEMFGPSDPNSKICFTDAATLTTHCQFIDTWRCAIQQTKVNVAFGNNLVEITNMTAPATSGMDPDIITIQWDTTYTGNNSVTEKVTYINTDITNPPQHFMQTGSTLFIPAKVSAMTSMMTINTKSWPAGHYTIRVSGVASDAKNPAAAERYWIKQGPASPKYIKLE